MDKHFCIGCNTAVLPTCAVYKIISSIDMNTFLQKSLPKKINILVCHNNAQEIKDNHLNIKENCDGCGLCLLTCLKTSNEILFNEQLEKILFSNLNSLNLYLSEMCKDCKIGSEIKSFGNYRQKRIDIVIQKKQTVYLVKILSDINKYRFYMDSYNEQVAIYNEIFGDYNFVAYPLIKRKELPFADKQKLNVITIIDLVKILGE